MSIPIEAGKSIPFIYYIAIGTFIGTAHWLFRSRATTSWKRSMAEVKPRLAIAPTTQGLGPVGPDEIRGSQLFDGVETVNLDDPMDITQQGELQVDLSGLSQPLHLAKITIRPQWASTRPPWFDGFFCRWLIGDSPEPHFPSDVYLGPFQAHTSISRIAFLVLTVVGLFLSGARFFGHMSSSDFRVLTLITLVALACASPLVLVVAWRATSGKPRGITRKSRRADPSLDRLFRQLSPSLQEYLGGLEARIPAPSEVSAEALSRLLELHMDLSTIAEIKAVRLCQSHGVLYLAFSTWESMGGSMSLGTRSSRLNAEQIVESVCNRLRSEKTGSSCVAFGAGGG